MEKINTKLLAEKFRPISGKGSRDSEIFFKQIREAMRRAHSKDYTQEDIVGLCAMAVLAECTWLESKRDAKNVNVFMRLLFEEMGKDPSLVYDDEEFYKFLSTILALVSQG